MLTPSGEEDAAMVFDVIICLCMRLLIHKTRLGHKQYILKVVVCEITVVVE